LLQPGGTVVHDAKVIPARLTGRRIGWRQGPPSRPRCWRLDGARWRAFVKPAKRLSPGDVVRFGDEGSLFSGSARCHGGVQARAAASRLHSLHGPVDQAVDGAI
jgi:S-adenosylmethionine:tRNA ribosyltransferase-isomerase